MEYVILATEGAHDQAILCSFLRFMGFRSMNASLKDLDPFWQDLMPRFPKDMSYHGYKNLLYPYIFVSEDISAAVYQGKGQSLAQNILDITQNYPRYRQDIAAFGIVVDADDKQPLAIGKQYAEKLVSSFPSFPAISGNIMPGSPRTGLYIWPDSRSVGTLETLLIECASLIYPDHKRGAETFIDGLEARHKEHWRTSDANKALVASIVSILQPGQANHASFARLDDRWVSKQTIESIVGMNKFWTFIHDLLGLTL